eukprot:2733194-Prymnesium_polylepis.1
MRCPHVRPSTSSPPTRAQARTAAAAGRRGCSTSWRRTTACRTRRAASPCSPRPSASNAPSTTARLSMRAASS